MWLFLFILFATSLFIAPLLPALFELLRPTDVQPLNIEYDHDRNIKRFAQKFAQLSRSYLNKIPVAYSDAEEVLPQIEPDAELLIVEADTPVLLNDEEMQRRVTGRRLVGEKNLEFPDTFVFVQEVFAVGNIRGGIANRFRALMAEGSIALGANSEVLRWVHAARLRVGPDTALYGRASAEEEILFLGSAQFERLNAPRICFGEVDNKQAVVERARASALDQLAAQLEQRPGEGRMIAGADLTIPAETVLEGDLIVYGKLRIGKDALVLGSIKTYGDTTLETGAIIRGALVSTGRIVCGEISIIDGPLISENAILIGSDSRIGSAGHPTSVNAPFIKFFGANSIVHGTVWAHQGGLAVSTR